jgi:hypothetical protein
LTSGTKVPFELLERRQATQSREVGNERSDAALIVTKLAFQPLKTTSLKS